MNRYSKITKKNPREIILLKSFPCQYRGCSFCNYTLDNSTDLDEICTTDSVVINKITGEFAILEVINSATVFDLPGQVLQAINSKVKEKSIKVLYFEVHYMQADRLNEIRGFFSDTQVRFRVGIETFDNVFRNNAYNKRFMTDDISKAAKTFHSCILLICTKGQTKQQILDDIKIAKENFRETIINVFVDNDTAVKSDPELCKWFMNEVYPDIKDVRNIEILLDNKDFGVFVQ